MKIDDPMVQKLLAENQAFQRLWERHQRYELELAEFDRASYLSAEQDLQRKTIQKLKLAGKDEMTEMLRAAGGQ